VDDWAFVLNDAGAFAHLQQALNSAARTQQNA
jgi:hypothetical protein